MGLFSKTESYVGIDLGAHGIKLVELHKVKNRPQLWTYGILDKKIDIHQNIKTESSESEPVEKTVIAPDDPRVNEYADQLKQLMKKANVTTRRATASLPVSYIFHSLVTLPFIEEKNRSAIIQAEVSKLVSRPVSDLQVIYQLLPNTEKDPKYLQFLVTSAPKDVVAFYTAIFQKAGLELMELETEAFAIERSLVGKDTATAMVIDIGSQRTNFFIIDNGLPMTHRSIHIGGDMIEDTLEGLLDMSDDSGQLMRDVSRLPADQVPVEVFNNFINPILKEVEFNFDVYLQQIGNQEKKPQKIILTGGASAFPIIQKSLQEAFNLKVFVGDPWSRIVYQQGLRPTIAALGPRMAVSIGLALRHFN